MKQLDEALRHPNGLFPCMVIRELSNGEWASCGKEAVWAVVGVEAYELEGYYSDPEPWCDDCIQEQSLDRVVYNGLLIESIMEMEELDN